MADLPVLRFYSRSHPAGAPPGGGGVKPELERRNADICRQRHQKRLKKSALRAEYGGCNWPAGVFRALAVAPASELRSRAGFSVGGGLGGRGGREHLTPAPVGLWAPLLDPGRRVGAFLPQPTSLTSLSPFSPLSLSPLPLRSVMYVFGGFNSLLLSDVLAYVSPSCSAFSGPAACARAWPGLRCVWNGSLEACLPWGSGGEEQPPPSSLCSARSCRWC